MQAKKVYESLEFKQGGDPYGKLGIGVIRIKDLPGAYYSYIDDKNSSHIAKLAYIPGDNFMSITLCHILFHNTWHLNTSKTEFIECPKCITKYRQLK